jgi:shikimate dehydrogenase
MNRQFGLIGYPLSHSFSKRYFEDKFAREGIANCHYNLFPIESPEWLEAVVATNPELAGLNVTIPHKETVLPYLNETDETALIIGAVNCIRISRMADGNPHLKGFNTDYIGFKQSLEPLMLPHHTAALVLGSGGASKAVTYALNHLGIEYKTVSRNSSGESLRYGELDAAILDYYTIIINTTPLGTYPDIATYPPIPYHLLGPQHLLYDLVYNPGETMFLTKGRTQGTAIKNGQEMLELQAEEGWKIWTE